MFADRKARSWWSGFRGVTDAKPNDHHLTLRLTDTRDYLTQFTDRPLRQAFVVANVDFARRFISCFARGAPNAVLTFTHPGTQIPDSIVLTIRHPRLLVWAKTHRSAVLVSAMGRRAQLGASAIPAGRPELAFALERLVQVGGGHDLAGFLALAGGPKTTFVEPRVPWLRRVRPPARRARRHRDGDRPWVPTSLPAR